MRLRYRDGRLSAQCFLLRMATLAAVTVAVASDCVAAPRNDFYISQAMERYFSLPQDARTISNGGSDALLCRGSICNFNNPAGLGFTPRTSLGLTAASRSLTGEDFTSPDEIEQVEDRGYLATAIPFGEVEREIPRYGTLGLALSRYHGDTNDPINSTPDGSRRTVAYGFAPAENISIGYSFTFYDDQLRTDLADLHSHARFLHLFGLQADLGDGFSFGGLFQLGIGQSDTEDFNLQPDGLSHIKQYTSAISVKKSWDGANLSLGADYSDFRSEGNLLSVSEGVVIGGDENGSLYNLRLGGEAEVYDSLFFRAGARFFAGTYNFLRPDIHDLSGDMHGGGFSSGLGYAFDIAEYVAKIDYGVEYLTSGRGGWQHVLTFAVEL